METLDAFVLLSVRKRSRPRDRDTHLLLLSSIRTVGSVRCVALLGMSILRSVLLAVRTHAVLLRVGAHTLRLHPIDSQRV